MTMASPATIGEQYNDRYTPNTDGDTPFSDNFGPFKTPAAHVLEITTHLRQALVENYPDYFDVSTEELPQADKEIAAELSVLQSAAENIKPAEAYDFLIRKIIGPQFKRLEADKGKIVLNLLDFGGGDGRYWEFYNSLAKVLIDLNVGLSVCFNDLASQGLKAINIKAEKLGFTRDPFDNDLWVLDDNFSLKTVHTNDPNNHQAAKILIERAMQKDCRWGRNKVASLSSQVSDVSVAIFGVMSSIYTWEMRRPVLKLLHNMTSTAVMLDLATVKFLDTFANDETLHINSMDGERGLVTYSYPEKPQTALQYALFGGEDKNKRLKVNDINIEIATAISSHHLLRGTSFRYLSMDPEFSSASFGAWVQDLVTASNPKIDPDGIAIDRIRAEYILETIYPNKREIKPSLHQSSR